MERHGLDNFGPILYGLRCEHKRPGKSGNSTALAACLPRVGGAARARLDSGFEEPNLHELGDNRKA